MRKILLVMRQELAVTFRRPAYLIIGFIVPVLAAAILVGITLIRGNAESSGETTPNTPIESEVAVEGYVDQSGVIRAVPPDLSASLLPYESESQAQEALASGEITAYYLIPPDYIERGEVFYVYPPTRSLIEDGQNWVIHWALTFNLVGGNLEAANRVWNPIWYLDTANITLESQPDSASDEDCSRPGAGCESSDALRYLPIIMAALFFGLIMLGGTMLFQSISAERENRTIEVMLLSIKPRQMLAGKAIALSIAALLQTIVWLVAIVISFTKGGQTLALPENFTFPASILIWSLVFFLGGYGVYASLMAGAGAMTPKMTEAGAVTTIMAAPLMVGYVVGLASAIAGVSDRALPVALSLFPLTAPLVMVVRLVHSTVPLWQLFLSAGLTFLTAFFTLRGAAALFQAQTLLSGQPFSVGRYFRALLGRADGSG